MSKKILLGASLLAITAAASADVLVTTPEEIIVVSINDKEIRGGLFGGNKNTYRLEAGGHQIAVKYQQLFEENYINHDIVRSGVISLNTPVLNDGETYQLVLIDAPKNHDAAKKFAQQPTIGLKNQKGEIVVQQTGANTASQPWLSTLLGGKGSEVDARGSKTTLSSQQVIPAATPAKVITPVASAASLAKEVQAEKPTTQPPIGTIAAKDRQLIELWQSATPQERQKFMAWLTEQASK